MDQSRAVASGCGVDRPRIDQFLNFGRGDSWPAMCCSGSSVHMISRYTVPQVLLYGSSYVSSVARGWLGQKTIDTQDHKLHRVCCAA